MPDLQQFAVTRTGSTVNANVPEYLISGVLCDSQSGAVLHDFSGANGIRFPQIWASLTNAQQDAAFTLLVRELIRLKTGL